MSGKAATAAQTAPQSKAPRYQTDTRSLLKDRVVKHVLSRTPWTTAQKQAEIKIWEFVNPVCQQYVAWKLSSGLLLILSGSQPWGVVPPHSLCPLLADRNSCFQIFALNMPVLIFSRPKVNEKIMYLVKRCPAYLFLRSLWWKDRNYFPDEDVVYFMWYLKLIEQAPQCTRDSVKGCFTSYRLWLLWSTVKKLCSQHAQGYGGVQALTKESPQWS